MSHQDNQSPVRPIQSVQSSQSASAPLGSSLNDASTVVAPPTSTGAPVMTISAPGTQEPPFAWTVPTVRTVVDQILTAMLAGQLSLGGERIADVEIKEETAERLLVTLQMASGRSRLMSFAVYVYAPTAPLPTPLPTRRVGVEPADGGLDATGVPSANATPPLFPSPQTDLTPGPSGATGSVPIAHPTTAERDDRTR